MPRIDKRYKKVKHLIELLQELDPEAYIAKSGYDHSYDPISCEQGDAALDGDGYLSESAGNEDAIVKVVIFR